MTPLTEFKLKFHPREKAVLMDPRSGDHGNIIFRHLQVINNVTVVVYTLIYDANYSIGLGHNLGGNKCPILGYHDRDVETIAFYLYPQDNKEDQIYMSAHSKEGKWYRASQCQYEDGNLIIYVALNSHANYPKEGTKWRFLGLANDHCSSQGKTISMSEMKICSNDFYRREIPPPPE